MSRESTSLCRSAERQEQASCGKSPAFQSKIYYLLDNLTFKGLVEDTGKFPREATAKPFLRFALEFLNEKKVLLKEISEKIEEHREVMKKIRRYVQVLG